MPRGIYERTENNLKKRIEKLKSKEIREKISNSLKKAYKEGRVPTAFGLGQKRPDVSAKEFREKVSKGLLRAYKENRKKVNPDFYKKGPNRPNFKGRLEKEYILIYSPNHPNRSKSNYVPEHRLIMEKHLGRNMAKKEVVHHIDFDKYNNNINNLHLFENKSEHCKYHWFLINTVKEFLGGLK